MRILDEYHNYKVSGDLLVALLSLANAVENEEIDKILLFYCYFIATNNNLKTV